MKCAGNKNCGVKESGIEKIKEITASLGNGNEKYKSNYICIPGGNLLCN